MADTPQEYRKLSREELEEMAGEELPERAAMSLINANIAIPVNAAADKDRLRDLAKTIQSESLERARTAIVG